MGVYKCGLEGQGSGRGGGFHGGGRVGEGAFGGSAAEACLRTEGVSASWVRVCTRWLRRLSRRGCLTPLPVGERSG